MLLGVARRRQTWAVIRERVLGEERERSGGHGCCWGRDRGTCATVVPARVRRHHPAPLRPGWKSLHPGL